MIWALCTRPLSVRAPSMRAKKEVDMTESPAPQPAQADRQVQDRSDKPFPEARRPGCLLSTVVLSTVTLTIGIGLVTVIVTAIQVIVFGFEAGGESIIHMSLVFSPFCGLLNGLFVGLVVFVVIQAGRKVVLDRQSGRLSISEGCTRADALRMGARWFLGTTAAAAVGYRRGAARTCFARPR